MITVERSYLVLTIFSFISLQLLANYLASLSVSSSVKYTLTSMQTAMGITIRIFSDSHLEGEAWNFIVILVAC